MGLLVTTVIGYMVVLLFSALFTMHYLGKALNAKDSEIVDPKPETDF